jgi:hypothetical protein
MLAEAYVVGVTTQLVEHGTPVRILFVALGETPEGAIEAVRAKVSTTCAVDKHVAGTLSHETARKLGLRPGQVRQL